MAKNQHKTDKQNISVYVDKSYKEFVNDNLVKYENTPLNRNILILKTL